MYRMIPTRLFRDKPTPDTMCGHVTVERVAPGVVLPEWKRERGYIMLYHYKRRKSKKAIIFVHGGALTGLSPSETSYKFFAQELCKRTKTTVIVPDYPLPPVQTYPAQTNAILRTRIYFKDTYNDYVLGSDSAGGAIAMSLLLKSSDLFSRAFFISPWLNLQCDSVSYQTRAYCPSKGTGDIIFKNTPKETQRHFKKTALEYLGDESRLSDSVANPFIAGRALLRGLCPVFFLVGDEEILRNDTLDFAARAQQVNSSILVGLYDGMWHDWVMYSQRSSKQMGQTAYQQISNFVSHCNISDEHEEQLSVTCDILLKMD